jgi:hypothetical protein
LLDHQGHHAALLAQMDPSPAMSSMIEEPAIELRHTTAKSLFV